MYKAGLWLKLELGWIGPHDDVASGNDSLILVLGSKSTTLVIVGD